MTVQVAHGKWPLLCKIYSCSFDNMLPLHLLFNPGFGKKEEHQKGASQSWPACSSSMQQRLNGYHGILRASRLLIAPPWRKGNSSPSLGKARSLRMGLLVSAPAFELVKKKSSCKAFCSSGPSSLPPPNIAFELGMHLSHLKTDFLFKRDIFFRSLQASENSVSTLHGSLGLSPHPSKTSVTFRNSPHFPTPVQSCRSCYCFHPSSAPKVTTSQFR